jgi:WhiB family redox-sensing transcriptional regulator
VRDPYAVENWRADAKCKGLNTELWFPPREKELYKTIADQAKNVCFGRDGRPECPVRKDCLLYSEDMNEQYGIWGGLSHRERNALKRKAAKHGMTIKQWVENNGKK